MEDLKLKREAYINRIKELEAQERSTDNPEELKGIKKKIRNVKRNLNNTWKHPKRKDYTVKVRYEFEGEFTVYAFDKEEAKKIVREQCGTVLGDIQAKHPEVLNWNFPKHPNTKIIR